MRILKVFLPLACLTIYVLFSAPVLAIPVTWTLQNVAFDDGGMAIGSFVFDADVDTFQSINITTIDNGGKTESTYRDLLPTYRIPGFPSFTLSSNSEGFALVSNGSLPDLTGEKTFLLDFGLGLTNTQTFVNVFIFSAEGICATPTCDFFNPQRNVNAGFLTGVPSAPAMPPIPNVPKTPPAPTIPGAPSIPVMPPIPTNGPTIPGVPGTPIPEPSTMVLFGTGIAGFAVWRWKKNKPE